jgi:hypothetical protein
VPALLALGVMSPWLSGAICLGFALMFGTEPFAAQPAPSQLLVASQSVCGFMGKAHLPDICIPLSAGQPE